MITYSWQLYRWPSFYLIEAIQHLSTALLKLFAFPKACWNNKLETFFSFVFLDLNKLAWINLQSCDCSPPTDRASPDCQKSSLVQDDKAKKGADKCHDWNSCRTKPCLCDYCSPHSQWEKKIQSTWCIHGFAKGAQGLNSQLLHIYLVCVKYDYTEAQTTEKMMHRLRLKWNARQRCNL